MKDKARRRAYITWWSMVHRCTRQTDPGWADYGGRGITVCESWHSFPKFVDEMGYPPEGKTLERIDNDSGYCAANCRWASRKEQARNRRSNHPITINGETKLLTEWAEQAGIRAKVVAVRLFRGWTVERALTNTDFRRKKCLNA
jgi:hypothetical protein